MTPPLGTRGLTEPFAYGRGFSQWSKGVSPAAGAPYIHKIAGQWSTRVLALNFTIVTSATVANRAVTVDYCDPDGVVFASMGFGAVITASTTQVCAGLIDRSVAEWATGTVVFFPLADIFIDSGNAFRINVANIAAADQISGITQVLERFPTGHRGYPEGDIVERGRR